eukprot:7386273-Prymnesium_polylepis.1
MLPPQLFDGPNCCARLHAPHLLRHEGPIGPNHATAGRPLRTRAQSTSHQSPVTSHQSSVISHQSSVISHQPSAISHQSSVISHQSPAHEGPVHRLEVLGVAQAAHEDAGLRVQPACEDARR